MKKTISALLCAVLLLSLTACGASAPADTGADAPASALELLENVWNSYSDEEKFPAAGGDYSEENMRDGAPGNFSIRDAEILNSSLGFPSDEAGKIDGAASLVHMMNLNTFTCGAFHVKNSGDVSAVADALRQNVQNTQWMCGFPDKLVVLTYGEYVVALFGADDLVDDFVNTMTATYTGVQTACDEPLQ